MEASWMCLGASWTCLGENVGKRSSVPYFLERFWKPKWKQNSLKFMFKIQLAFPVVFQHIVCDFLAFVSQLVRTCSRKILAKHWLLAQKLSFAWDSLTKSLIKILHSRPNF